MNCYASTKLCHSNGLGISEAMGLPANSENDYYLREVISLLVTPSRNSAQTTNTSFIAGLPLDAIL
jgi:hypothetical protein